MSSYARVKVCRAERRKKGLCYHCTDLAEPGRTSCTYHLRKLRTYTKASKKKNTDTGKCTRCSRKLDLDLDKGYKNCQNCREHSLQFQW